MHGLQVVGLLEEETSYRYCIQCLLQWTPSGVGLQETRSWLVNGKRLHRPVEGPAKMTGPPILLQGCPKVPSAVFCY
jgi:hypothetical protein